MISSSMMEPTVSMVDRPGASPHTVIEVVNDDMPDHQCERCGAPFRLDQWRRTAR